jgi:hypothetical protein
MGAIVRSSDKGYHFIGTDIAVQSARSLLEEEGEPPFKPSTVPASSSYSLSTSMYMLDKFIAVHSESIGPDPCNSRGCRSAGHSPFLAWSYEPNHPFSFLSRQQAMGQLRHDKNLQIPRPSLSYRLFLSSTLLSSGQLHYEALVGTLWRAVRLNSSSRQLPPQAQCLQQGEANLGEASGG